MTVINLFNLPVLAKSLFKVFKVQHTKAIGVSLPQNLQEVPETEPVSLLLDLHLQLHVDPSDLGVKANAVQLRNFSVHFKIIIQFKF